MREQSLLHNEYPIDVEVIKQDRMKRSETLFDESGVDTVIAWSGSSHSDRGAVRWFTNYFTDALATACVVSRDGRTTLLLPYISDMYWASQLSWADENKLYGDLQDGLVKELRAIGPKRIGLAGFPPVLSSIPTYLQEQFPTAEFIDLSVPFDRMRLIKSEVEMQLFRKTGEIIDNAFESMVANYREGMSEAEVKGEMQRAAYSFGGEIATVNTSTNERVIQSVSLMRPLASGDLLQVSIEVAGPGGYWIQTVRTYMIGESSDPRTGTLTSACIAALEAAVSLMTPGHHMDELIEAANAVIEPVLEELDAEQLVPYGHGMGLDLGEGYSLGDKELFEIEPGMIITFHPNGYGQSIGAFLGNTYMVGSSGAESLSEIPVDVQTL